MNKNLERFLKYVKIDTQSDELSNTIPSTLKQLDLAKVLYQELLDLNVKCKMSEDGIIMGEIPSNIDKDVPTIGFLAHMDTAMDLTGKDVNPKIIENYNLEDINLNEEYTLSKNDYPSLNNKLGHTLITTSGNTLLGADDKAGITIIMGLIDYLLEHKEFKHGTVKFAFTIDEEIGRGTDTFDIEKFGCDYAYTVDGGNPNEVEYECFNAASCNVEIKGVSIHTGSAKGIMINSQHLAMEFFNKLPKELDPSLTSGYEGFNHLHSIEGEVELTKMSFLIRNHDKELFNKQKLDFINAQEYINKKYNKELCKVTIKDTYSNMKDYLENKMYVVDIAYNALKNVGLNPISNPIRGGTDGARLTMLGLPCPNLGTGGYNFHGRYEYLSLNELEKMIDVLKEIVKLSCN